MKAHCCIITVAAFLFSLMSISSAKIIANDVEELRPSSRDVHLVVKRALIAGPDGTDARVQELVNVEATKLSPAEKARCIGLLHSCQTWLELEDGKENHIVITAPDDDTKQLIDKKVTLPHSGDKVIGNDVWSLLQESCRYGLADLRKCSKPDHWPLCTGASC